MALNTFKCNYLTPLHFEGLKFKNSSVQIHSSAVVASDVLV